MEKKHQILIIGAGTAGITVAARLLRANSKLDVALIDPAEKHYYQPAWTLVGAGSFSMKATERSMASLIPRRATWIQDAVSDIDPDEKKVSTENGDVYGYDYLVLCPGIAYDLEAVECLREAVDREEVCSNYIDPEYTWKVLQNFRGGIALFTQPEGAIKCGGAPQKIMYLADEYFKRKGVRDKTQIVFATPGSVIFGVEPFRSELEKIVDRKNIQLRFFHTLKRIDLENKTAIYTISQAIDEPDRLYRNYTSVGEQMVSDKDVAIPFDMLHLAPPQMAPKFVQDSKLAVQEGPGRGWIDVDIHTLQHNRYPNVFGLGDAAHLPTAKTGAAVRKQAPVVVENILHLMRHEQQLSDDYQGYSSCPLVTGYGKMLLAEFNYAKERDSDPIITKFVDTSKERFSMWLLKKYGLPFMYWNLMLKGRA